MEEAEPTFLGDSTDLQVFREAAQKNDPGIWNRWRYEHKVTNPTLRGANLSGLVLHGVDLQFADLSEACLTEATITGSFDYAVLNKANLTGARMWSCRFEET